MPDLTDMDAKQYFARRHPQWLHDFSRLFDDENSVYAGFCHVFETENYTLCKEMLRYVPYHVEKFRCSDIKTSGIQKNT